MSKQRTMNREIAEMRNPVQEFKRIIYENIFEGLETLEDQVDFAYATSTLLRLHVEKLNTAGDFTLACMTSYWKQRILNVSAGLKLRKDAKDLFENTETNKENVLKWQKALIDITAKSAFPVERFEILNNQGVGFLQRERVMRNVLHMILEKKDVYGQLLKNNQQKVKLFFYEPPENTVNLSFYRAQLVHNVMKKLLKRSSWTLIEENDPELYKNVLNIHVKSVSENFVCNNGQRNCILKCGLVKNPSTGKVGDLTAASYNKLRANDMLLMARHKYGIRIKCDESFMAHISRLGKAAATFDLLEVKHSSPVKIKINGHGCTKCGSFILYNSARLETLLRTFDERVKLGSFPALPELSQIDFSLLREEVLLHILY